MLKPAQAGQTALSGSQIKPPALPEVHDSESVTCMAILVERALRPVAIGQYLSNGSSRSNSSNRLKRLERLEQLERFELHPRGDT